LTETHSSDTIRQWKRYQLWKWP